jgi:hypothetical protein
MTPASHPAESSVGKAVAGGPRRDLRLWGEQAARCPIGGSGASRSPERRKREALGRLLAGSPSVRLETGCGCVERQAELRRSSSLVRRAPALVRRDPHGLWNLLRSNGWTPLTLPRGKRRARCGTGRRPDPRRGSTHVRGDPPLGEWADGPQTRPPTHTERAWTDKRPRCTFGQESQGQSAISAMPFDPHRPLLSSDRGCIRASCRQRPCRELALRHAH